MSPEDFARFLECLAPDTNEAGRLYTALHKKLICFFAVRGISDPENAADDTIDRAVLKITAGAIVPDVNRFCLGIARNIAKERYRIEQREHSAFQEFVGVLGSFSPEDVERIYSILKPCFEQLAVKEQQLLLAYCREKKGRARAKYRDELARAMKISVAALRIRVTRLRSNLSDCVQRQSNQPG